MSVSLSKGGNVSLTKEAPGLTAALVGLGWDARTTSGAAFDLDASALLLNSAGKVLSDQHFVFFNNLTSPDGSVEHTGDNLTGEGEGDDESIKVDLSRVPADVDKIVFTVDTNDEDIDNRLINNIADVDISGTGVQVATQSKILTNPTLKARADNPVTGATRYLAIESKVAPFDNIHCRLAVQYGVSKVDFQTARGGPIGGGDIGTTMLNPAVKGYTKFDLYPDNNGQGDVTKAKEELGKCGKSGGFTTHMATQSTTKGKAVAAAVQNSLKRIGITVVIDEGDAATYYSQFIGAPAVNRSKGRGLMYAGWGADWPTGYGFFSSLIDGRKILPQGNSNYSETNDPKINQMIDQAVGTTDPNAAAKIWGDVDKQLMQVDATLVPMTYDKALVINSTNVTNAYILSSMLGTYDFQAMGKS